VRFLYDGWNLLSIVNSSSSVLQSFLWGSDLSGSTQGAGGVGGLLGVFDSTLGSHFAAFDGNGNVSCLAKASDGTASAIYLYGPFGEVLRATGAMAKVHPLRFSTKYQDDETDTLYYGYRYYGPSSGSWLSRDPIDESGGINLHCFAGNNAICYCDPLGQLRMSLADMQVMLLWSSKEFHARLVALCPKSSVEWNTAKGLCERCTPESCEAQAEVLTRDYAHYLKATFTAQYKKFGDVLAFTPIWLLTLENINDRAYNAPNHGDTSNDYDKGFGLRCGGMQSLMQERFLAIIGPWHRAGRQCFKGARVGNNQDVKKATHAWFAIYSVSNPDFRKIDVHVDPWYSAGGIISSDSPQFGQAQYFSLDLW
jgi:RHS repeat-associated protein